VRPVGSTAFKQPPVRDIAARRSNLAGEASLNMLAILWSGLILATLAGAAAGRFPGIAMNRATIALVGATALVLTGAISRQQAYAAIDLDTIALLLAMMVINVNFRMAGFFALVARVTVNSRLAPIALLAALMAAAGTLSAVFLNDTIALAFTPLVIEVVLARRLKPAPFLIGLAMAANIGSVATQIGNPQNMLIGIASGLDFVSFAAALWPVGAGGLLISWAVLVILFRRDLTGGAAAVSIQAPLNRPLLAKCGLAAAVLLAALIAGVPVSLAALAGASLLLITRTQHPARVFQEIDWGLLVFFAALFVVTGAVQTTGFAATIISRLDVDLLAHSASLTATAAILSNLVSNVPAVLLLAPLIETLPAPENAWLVLAMATTFAGNLTLLGSVANLIVAEQARRHEIDLGFWTYLKAGIPVTLATLLWGVWWLP